MVWINENGHARKIINADEDDQRRCGKPKVKHMDGLGKFSKLWISKVIN